MIIKNRISLFVATFLIVGFLSVTLIENANAQGSDPICVLNIEKVSIPADNTPFDFIITGDGSGQFSLSDPGNPTTFIELDDPQTVTVTEELPPGWELDKIECTELPNDCGDTPCLNITINEETNSITAQCLDNDEGTCTFTNVKLPTNVPTLSEWGLIAMASILGIVGFMVIRRKKVTV